MPDCSKNRVGPTLEPQHITLQHFASFYTFKLENAIGLT